MTSKKYRPWNPDQAYLFPPSMRDWLEEDHLVYRLLDVVEGVTNQALDQEHLVPMMKRVKSNTGRTPTVLTADTGYGSARSRDRVSRRPEPPSPAQSPKNPDPKHDCPNFKDSQSESQ